MEGEWQMTRIIALANQKGGVGKTTITMNIGAGLVEDGKKVLYVDIDPQGNLSAVFDVNAENTIYELMNGSCKDLDHAVYPILDGKADLIPAGIELAAAELELMGQPGREYFLKEILQQIQGKYDYILIDCPPSLGLLTLNALTAATEVIVIMKADFFSLVGMNQLIDTVNTIQRRVNQDLKISGVIINMYNNRLLLHKDSAAVIADHCSGLLFDTRIRNCVALSEATGHGQSIFDYAAKSNGADDFRAITEEIERGAK